MLPKIIRQVNILLWKRFREIIKNKWEIVRVLLLPIIFFALINLGYSTLKLFNAGAIEPFLVPLAFIVYAQRIVVQIMYEKANRLHEAMKMMGLTETAYWVSYFISEGIITGFVISFICSLMSLNGLFNGAGFGTILGLLFVFTLSVVPFCFFVCSFFDTPQSAGQAILGLIFGFYAVYVIVFLTKRYTIPIANAQIACCFFPPLALQIGSGSFLKSHQGINISTICGIMVST